MQNHQTLPPLLREVQILGNRVQRRKQQQSGKKVDEPIEPIIPVSHATWWAGIKTNRFPKPVKLGIGRSVFWRREDILALIEQANASEAA